MSFPLTHVDRLRKHELLFELGIRAGQVSLAAEWATVLEAVRLVKDKPPVALPEKHELVAQSPHVCTEALAELGEALQDLENEGPPTKGQQVRLFTRIQHYINRLDYILTYVPQASLVPRVKTLKQNFEGLSEKLKDLVRRGEEATQPSVSEPLAPPTMNPVATSMTPFRALKIVHPLQQLVDEVGMFEVLDVPSALVFLKFLVRVRNIATVHSVPGHQALQAVSTKLKGIVLQLLLRARQAVDPIETFHALVLDFFIPRRESVRLLQGHYLRPQALSESFVQYMERVKEVALVLRLPDTERAVCDVILSGLNPEARSSLVFASRPSTFAALESLVPLLGECAAVDRSRLAETSGLTPPLSEVSCSENRPRAVLHPKGVGLRCYRCHEAGHIVKECRSPRPGNTEFPQLGRRRPI